MIGFFALALPAAVCAADISAPTVSLPIIASDSLKAAFDGGQRWTDFYPTVTRRKEVWDRAWTTTKIPDSLAARARGTGPWRILVITEPGCSDSANSVPIIARLAELVPSIEVRLVNSTVGKPWMEAHRTPDGRPATPTILLLDDTYSIRGCWVEQPKALQDFWLPIIARKETGTRFEEKMSWYVNDDGREILRELVEMLEAGKSGTPVCRRG